MKVPIAAKPHKWFTNIPISQATKVELAESDESCELLLSDENFTIQINIPLMSVIIYKNIYLIIRLSIIHYQVM